MIPQSPPDAAVRLPSQMRCIMAGFIRTLAFGFASFAALALCGCGDPTGEVSGKVTYNNVVVKGGSVTFINTSGKPSVSTQIGEDGSYTASNVPYGEAKICVDTEALNPAKKSKVPKYGPPAGQTGPQGLDKGGEDMSKRYVKIPEQYAKPDATDLKLTVGAGRVQHNIELK